MPSHRLQSSHLPSGPSLTEKSLQLPSPHRTGPGTPLADCPAPFPALLGAGLGSQCPAVRQPAFTYSSTILSRGSLRAFLTNITLEEEKTSHLSRAPQDPCGWLSPTQAGVLGRAQSLPKRDLLWSQGGSGAAGAR